MKKTRTDRQGDRSRTHNSREKRIEKLLRTNPGLWRGCNLAGQGRHGLSTGFVQLDAILPGRGWPANGLIEIINPCRGIGELQLLVPLMRSVVGKGQWVLWLFPPYELYAPALVQAGIDTRQVLVVKSEDCQGNHLWTMEKALQAKSCGLALMWRDRLPDKALRRLQLAAEAGNRLGILFRRYADRHSSPLPTRLRLKDFPPRHDSRTGDDNRWGGLTEVTLIKARGNFRPLSVTIDLYQHWC